MKLFLKRSRGSVTVLVTMILIPTIFFTGFLVDLSRLKLYGNQAVMTADNYGEAVLSQYDNLLKELYGLFAITQDKNVIKQLDELQKYMKSSFNPNENRVSWEHLSGIQDLLNTGELNGFMPYKEAKVNLEKEFIADANLRSNEILDTQIGDFMRFRIAQQLSADGEDLLELLEKTGSTEEDAKLIKKKIELEEKAEELLLMAQQYYGGVKGFTGYLNYISGINEAYKTCRNIFQETTQLDAYIHYLAFVTADIEDMKVAVEKRTKNNKAESDNSDNAEESTQEKEEGEAEENTEESTEENEEESTTESKENSSEKEPLTAKEEGLITIFDAFYGDTVLFPGQENTRTDWNTNYKADIEKCRTKFENEFERGIGILEAATVDTSYGITFHNFEEKLGNLKDIGNEITGKCNDISVLCEQLEELLKNENTDAGLKDGLEDDLRDIKELFSDPSIYRDLAEYIEKEDKEINLRFKDQSITMIDVLENRIMDHYLKGKEYTEEWPAFLDGNQWQDFKRVGRYGALYASLERTFSGEGDTAIVNQKKSEANNLTSEVQNELNGTEKSEARDIPGIFGYGQRYEGGFQIKDMIKNAADLFSLNGIKNQANRLLLKVYTVEYDLGMFSSRVTNVKNQEREQKDQEWAVSLTGYEMCRSYNYLYQAELEYLVGGSNSSDENLTAARNKILSVQAVMNYKATYTVKEVNRAIQKIAQSAGAINPILGVVVNGALRLGIAAVETVEDWKELKAGNEVCLSKKELDDLSSYNRICSLLNMESREMKSGNRTGLWLDYEKYLTIMMVFLTSSEMLTQRTGNLIELNVNAVKQKIGESGNLENQVFKLSNAYTAVNATCTVHLDFVVMPKGFARKTVDSSTYNELVEFEKNSYKFTVTRGY